MVRITGVFVSLALLVAALIASLRTQEEDLMDVFQEFELTVDIPQPGE